jgi:hypothetical protein
MVKYLTGKVGILGGFTVLLLHTSQWQIQSHLQVTNSSKSHSQWRSLKEA